MQRGEVWTLRDDGYASKARPVIVIQDENVATFDSIILCLLTTFDSEHLETRVSVDPSNDNGLERLSYAMTDKIVTVDKKLLGQCIGRLSDEDMANISAGLALILGLG